MEGARCVLHVFIQLFNYSVVFLCRKHLTERFGNGWSVETLEKCRKFYRIYSMQRISSTLLTKSESVHSVDEILHFTLSWSYYLILMRIENPDARSFYEIECTEQQWSVRQLSRQVGSSLYERLAREVQTQLLRPLCEAGFREAHYWYIAM